jgi:hypothetical protein
MRRIVLLSPSIGLVEEIPRHRQQEHPTLTSQSTRREGGAPGREKLLTAKVAKKVREGREERCGERCLSSKDPRLASKGRTRTWGTAGEKNSALRCEGAAS